MSTASGSGDLIPGSIIYLVMIDAGVRRPLQGMLVDQDEGPTVIVAVPARAPEASVGSSVAAATSTSHQVKSSLGTFISIVFHRVDRRSLSTEATRGTTFVYFTDAASDVCVPLLKAIRAALYSSDLDPERAATDTEDETIGLRAELLSMKKALAASETRARAAESSRTPVPTPPQAARRVSHSAQVRDPVQNLFDQKEDDDEFGEGSGDEDDPLMAALNTFARQAGGASSSSRPTAAGAGEAAGQGPDISALIQLQMLKEMKRMQKKDDGGDYSGGGGIDGLRILKTLGNLRNMKTAFKKHPAKISQEYTDEWEERLGARGRPWSWRDVAKHINWAKYRSMWRVYVMLGEIKSYLETNQAALAEAQTVQCMKSIHQFALDGSWRVAWPLTHMTDPIDKVRHGGKEEELEAVLAYLRTQDDIKKRSQGVATAKDAVSDDEESDGEEKVKKKPPWKVKKEAAEKAKAAAEKGEKK
jgi:hypothetical protein